MLEGLAVNPVLIVIKAKIGPDGRRPRGIGVLGNEALEAGQGAPHPARFELLQVRPKGLVLLLTGRHGADPLRPLVQQGSAGDLGRQVLAPTGRADGRRKGQEEGGSSSGRQV
jgi:hypothetical protein